MPSWSVALVDNQYVNSPSIASRSAVLPSAALPPHNRLFKRGSQKL